MCGGKSFKPKDWLNPYDGDSYGGRLTQYVDPAMSAIKNRDESQLDPWKLGKMFKGKEMPAPPPPPPRPQAAKTPDATPLKRRNGASGLAGSGGTLLTGSSGVSVGVGNLGSNSLLGG